MRRALLILALALAGGSARAETALLANGATLKVEAWSVSDTGTRLTLRGGGEVTLPGGVLVGLVPDEVLEEIGPAATPAELRALAVGTARRHGLDPDLVLAVVQVESGFRPDAVSPKGAKGLMQLMPGTASALGVSDALDPGQNLDGGTRHLGALVARYDGDLTRALAAYNAGEGAVARHGGVPPYRETRDYVQKVLRRYGPKKP
jgi:soluble lytic murein transglycosylase-like protein